MPQNFYFSKNCKISSENDEAGSHHKHSSNRVIDHTVIYIAPPRRSKYRVVALKNVRN